MSTLSLESPLYTTFVWLNIFINNVSSRWHVLKIYIYWQRWRKEYVAYLQLRNKWQKPDREMEVGDLVLIKDDNVPRNHWKRGVITETRASADGHIREVRLKTCPREGEAGKLTRPIHKLVLLLPNEQ